MYNHLGIVIQILKVLYEVSAHDTCYDVVCFLEHDVLYPEDYFDRVGGALVDNDDAVGVTNMDYIGLNHTGWVRVRERHEPLHQMSVRWDLAVRHFEEKCKDCIVEGGTFLEPSNRSKFVKIPFEDCRPSCHMNHTGHFTNHYATYERVADREEHPYWGDFRQYYPASEHSLE